MANHPIKDKPDFKTSAVPLRIFGDAVAVLGLAKSWGQSTDCISISSYLNFGPSKYSHMIFTLIFKSKKVSTTMKKVWRILRWSLDALFQGKHPPRNVDGSEWPDGSWQRSVANQPLAGGYCGVVVVNCPVACVYIYIYIYIYAYIYICYPRCLSTLEKKVPTNFPESLL